MSANGNSMTLDQVITLARSYENTTEEIHIREPTINKYVSIEQNSIYISIETPKYKYVYHKFHDGLRSEQVQKFKGYFAKKETRILNDAGLQVGLREQFAEFINF